MNFFQKNIAVISVLLAVILPLFIVIKAEKDFAAADIVRFDIEPYDPRDLMYGHYLQFKIKWNWKVGAPDKNICAENGVPCCLCVEEGAVNPLVSPSSCQSTAPSCKHVIKGQSGNGDFHTGLDRYYVDERLALSLENIFRAGKEKFSIGFSMRKNQKPAIETLYVGDKPLKEYVESKGGVIEPPPAAP